MPKAKFSLVTGEVFILDVDDGMSLMEAARQEGLDGIVAECGGGSICGTCHVIVGSAWFAELDEPEAPEEALLGMVPERAATSRLSCQVIISEGLDGIEVEVPSMQMDY